MVADHKFRESSSPILFPPIDQGWHGGPAMRRSAPRNAERSVRSSLSWMMLLNPLSLSVATHLSLASTRVRWWNPSDLAAWARPPHPENRSTTVLWVVGAAPSCLFECRSFTPSKLAGAGSSTPSSGVLCGFVSGSVGGGEGCGCSATPSSGVPCCVVSLSVAVVSWVVGWGKGGCLTTPSSDGGGWVVGEGGTAGGSCGTEVSYCLGDSCWSSRRRSSSRARRTASRSFCP